MWDLLAYVLAMETESIKNLLTNPNNPFLEIEVNKINICKECEYKYLCGGCRGISFLKNRSLLEKDSCCALNYRYYKKLIEDII